MNICIHKCSFKLRQNARAFLALLEYRIYITYSITKYKIKNNILSV